MVIETLNKENPFSDYGSIVEGKRFIGRKKEISQIYNRVLGTNYGNLSVIGLPRIGKSSLVWNGLYLHKNEVVEKNIFLHWLNLGTYSNPKELYKSLLNKIINNNKFIKKEVLEELQKIQNLYDETESKEEIQYFFELLKNLNYRQIFILDEFDYAQQFLKLEDFQFLRELSINPETKICLVTISRRTIQEIEPENGAISNFYGVFAEIRLQPFDSEEITEYWKRLENLQIHLPNEYKQQVVYYSGYHPYLLDLVNYHVFNEVHSFNDDILQVLSNLTSNLKKSLWDNYETILSLLEEEKLKNHFIQAVVGPKFNLTSMSIEKMLKYGLIQTIQAREKYGEKFEELLNNNLVNQNDISYISFAKHFDEYLTQKELDFDIWPLWNETEKLIRKLIKKYLKEKYGESWEDEFLNKNPNKEKEIVQMKKLRERNQKIFGDNASSHLVDYTYPQEMWDLFISNDWDWFQKVLKGHRSNWREKFLLLAKVRNPIAHSNKEFVDQSDLQKAEQICKEIVELLQI